ncbi:NAD-dependent epimerase/dehydratase [Suillus paluster]|uniref:NAD-dependent epimerase/dehydratase n=1 Tax=Suillus paluster TaxID=48578 RepID=UPI001B868D9F|nr:NAD-dependent epimerase/dehydratase [Suillus paluster]KAG1730868.1 NAD-dependent epimerase/dehydratase [Suillus paluster]
MFASQISSRLLISKECISNEVLVGNLCDMSFCENAVRGMDTILHFGRDNGERLHHIQGQFNNDIQPRTCSCMRGVRRFFYASSACVYPTSLQHHAMPTPVSLREQGLCHKMEIRIARFHNVFGPRGTWFGGHEKAPAAQLRKALAVHMEPNAQHEIEIWGDGKQLRSFLYINDCVEAILLLIESNCSEPINIGSDCSVAIEDLTKIAVQSVGMNIGDDSRPIGVHARNSNNDFVVETLGWTPQVTLEAGPAGTSLLRSLKTSEVVYLNKPTIHIRYLTSHHLPWSRAPEKSLDNLRIFAQSLARTTWRDTRELGVVRFQDDEYLQRPAKNDEKSNITESVLLEEGIVNVSTEICDVPRGHVCAIWRQCAHRAWKEEADYLVLMGDDVVLLDEGWMREIHKQRRPFPLPAVPQMGCSEMIPSRISNGVGGSLPARYTQKHADGWTFGSTPKMPHQHWRHGWRLMFIIIIDNPRSPSITELEAKYAHRPDVRIRVNERNLGASASRNRGMKESAAEWILFLDDDVTPRADILIETEKVIRTNPQAAGFIGNIDFPVANTIFTNAVHLAGVTFFWDIAAKMPRDESDMPWGVTANLIARHVQDCVEFDLQFPKTGGGEDIDFWFYPAPHVAATHPWWNEGQRSYWRFYMWSKGDGGLIKLYPNLTYLDHSPNSAELFLISASLAILGAFTYFSTRSTTMLNVAMSLAMATAIANIAHDVYRHLWRDADRTKALIAESALIRMASEGGRLIGLLERGEILLIGRRFDWFTGRAGDGPMNEERMNGRQRMTLAALIAGVLYFKFSY